MANIGKILWCDLTVKDAEKIKEFYEEVVGWGSSEVAVDDYIDFNMVSEEGGIIAGICHKKGSNRNIPPQWINYIIVKSLDESIRRCLDLGGKVVDGPRKMGKKAYALIRDPAGAFIALIES